MAEPMREGTPPAEGWWLCELLTCGRTNRVVLFWGGTEWRRGKDDLRKPEWPVISWEGPLVIQPEPSQGAREAADKIASKSYSHCGMAMSYKVILSAQIEQAITAAEQAAYQRGREEGRREERERCAKIARTFYCGSDACEAVQCVEKAIIATDQPAQPAERVIFCDVCGPNPETILLPDKFGTMQVFCKACHKSGQPAEPTIHVEKLCHCVRLWDGLWGSLALDEIGIYGNTGKAKKDCPDCGGTGRKPQPAESLEQRVARLEEWASNYPSWRVKK